jgi:hypothetical protein
VRGDPRDAAFEIVDIDRMKQGPLFRRQFFMQQGLVAEPARAGVEYLRLHGHSTNPAEVLHQRRLLISPGGTLDVVAESRGGAGLGRISYSTGLQAALKRGDDFLTYRFMVPDHSPPGSAFEVHCFGHDQVAAFHFTIEVAALAP